MLRNKSVFLKNYIIVVKERGKGTLVKGLFMASNVLTPARVMFTLKSGQSNQWCIISARIKKEGKQNLVMI